MSENEQQTREYVPPGPVRLGVQVVIGKVRLVPTAHAAEAEVNEAVEEIGARYVKISHGPHRGST